jgi:hypothetical protein
VHPEQELPMPEIDVVSPESFLVKEAKVDNALLAFCLHLGQAASFSDSLIERNCSNLQSQEWQ